MSLIDEYKRERKRLINLNYRLRKKGYNTIGLPPIPKRITKGSIRKLAKTILKLQVDRDNAKKKYTKKQSTKKKSTKKQSTKKKSTKKQSTKKQSTKKQSTKKQSTKKKSTKNQSTTKKPINKRTDKYLPNESDMIKESSLSFFANVDTMDSFIAQMNLSSRRGNDTHRANVHDLSVMLRNAFEKACLVDGETAVNKRLQDNAEIVNRAMETIEGYYKSSDEEALQEAIDAIEDLITIITDAPINQDTAKTLENLYNDTLSSYLTYDEIGNEFITEVVDNKRLVIDPETSELLDSFAI